MAHFFWNFVFGTDRPGSHALPIKITREGRGLTTTGQPTEFPAHASIGIHASGVMYSKIVWASVIAKRASCRVTVG